MEHLKRDIAWTTHDELIHEGVPIVGSNMVDIVNDMLRKRKTDPSGWQPFARQLRTINLPMELIGNAYRRAYIRQAKTTTTTKATMFRRTTAAAAATTPRADVCSVRRSLSWTPLFRRHSRMEHSIPTPLPERRRRHKAFASLANWEDFLRRCSTCS